MGCFVNRNVSLKTINMIVLFVSLNYIIQCVTDKYDKNEDIQKTSKLKRDCSSILTFKTGSQINYLVTIIWLCKTIYFFPLSFPLNYYHNNPVYAFTTWPNIALYVWGAEGTEIFSIGAEAIISKNYFAWAHPPPPLGMALHSEQQFLKYCMQIRSLFICMTMAITYYPLLKSNLQVMVSAGGTSSVGMAMAWPNYEKKNSMEDLKRAKQRLLLYMFKWPDLYII